MEPKDRAYDSFEHLPLWKKTCPEAKSVIRRLASEYSENGLDWKIEDLFRECRGTSYTMLFLDNKKDYPVRFPCKAVIFTAAFPKGSTPKEIQEMTSWISDQFSHCDHVYYTAYVDDEISEKTLVELVGFI